MVGTSYLLGSFDEFRFSFQGICPKGIVMNKRQYVEKVNELANEISDLEETLSNVTHQFKRVKRKLEELPAEEDEIDDVPADGEEK